MRSTLGYCLLVTVAVVFSSDRIWSQQPDASKHDVSPQLLLDGDLFVIKVPSSNAYLAYSKTGGKWSRHEFPQGVDATPVLVGTVAAFALEPRNGATIKELVVIDARGAFVVKKLPRETRHSCIPVIGGDVVAFDLDGTAHVFSGSQSKWDSTPAIGKLYVDETAAWMTSKRQVAIFSAQTAKWAVAELK